MKYIALFRGINVGKARWIEMKKLKELFETLGCLKVSTYINSGNVFFESGKGRSAIRTDIKAAVKEKFSFTVDVLVKTSSEMRKIAQAIPKSWKNDDTHKSDVAYLFAEIDSAKILADLPVNKEYIDIRYVKGALFWNVSRADYNKSRINKLISHQSYQFMTVRNINTARYLAAEA